MFATCVNLSLLFNLLQELGVACHSLHIESCAVLAVPEVVVEDVVAGVEPDSLLELEDGFLVQALRLVVHGQA